MRTLALLAGLTFALSAPLHAQDTTTKKPSELKKIESDLKKHETHPNNPPSPSTPTSPPSAKRVEAAKAQEAKAGGKTTSDVPPTQAPAGDPTKFKKP